jgi:hypothetical protein
MAKVSPISLADLIAQSGQQARRSADLAIRGLIEVADKLDMRETVGNLRQQEEELRSDTFKLIVMGRFKNGKSTLLNALLGGTTHPVVLEGHKGPMVVDDLPATATLTGVRYAEKPYVLARGFDSKAEEWSFARYLNESTLDVDEAVNQRRFEAIREFEMGYPARLCQEGVLVYDSPGLDEHNRRTLITREATKACDAAIIVYRSDTIMGQSELVEAASVIAAGTRVFTIVNRWNGRQVDDRLRKFVWNKYVRDYLEGPDWNNQDLSQRDIYFVDAEQARNGRYDDDTANVEASGLADFERALAKFLIEDRQHAHLEKFATVAGKVSAEIEVRISQRQRAAQQDQADLKTKYTAVPSKLAASRARPARLKKIFARYRADAEATLTFSFARLIAQIREQLPDYLERQPLSGGNALTKVLRQKKMKEEAATAISEFALKRIDEWRDKAVKDELAPILDRLGDEIQSEIDAISRELDEIRLQLGWSDLAVGGSAVRTSERVLAAVAGALFTGGVGAFTGGAGGWRGAAGSVAGAVGTSILMGVIGVTSVSIFLPATLAAALVLGSLAGGAGLENRVRKKVLKQIDEMLAQMPEEGRVVIVAYVAQKFELLETEVTKQVRGVIDEEQRHIQQGLEINQGEQEDREQAIAALNEAEAAFRQHSTALTQALVTARQTG